MNKRRLLCLLLAAMPFEHAFAATTKIRVGDGAGCQFNDIQRAIDMAPSGSEIDINASADPYEELALSVHDTTLTLIGGFASCLSDTAGTATTTITSDNVDTILEITGTTYLALHHLTLSGGDAQNGKGGAISFVGQGQLNLYDTVITQNLAVTGGGLYVLGNAREAAQLHIFSGTVISNNQASGDGGGVHIEGNALLEMYEPQSAIVSNRAAGWPAGNGYGGGIDAVGAVTVAIESPDYQASNGTMLGAISGNFGVHGAGIALRGGAQLKLFSSSRGHPVSITNNGTLTSLPAQGSPPIAQQGGAIYAADATTQVCGWGYRISGNQALYGGAMAVNAATVDLANTVCNSLVDQCTAGTPCNSITANTSSTANAIVAMSGGTFSADGVMFSGNTSAGVLIANASHLTLTNCLIADNQLGTGVIYAPGVGTSTTLDGCTLAGNTIADNGAALITSGGPLHLSNSILWQPALRSLAFSFTSTPDIENILASDVTSLLDAGANGTVFNIAGNNPLFVSVPGHDYHLLSTSPAIDYATTESFPATLDLDQNPRCQDFRHISDTQVCDVGAYEFPLTDDIFPGNFEIQVE